MQVPANLVTFTEDILNGKLHLLSSETRAQSITPFLTTVTFRVCFSNIYEFKFNSFLILAISKPGDSYRLLQRQKYRKEEIKP